MQGAGDQRQRRDRRQLADQQRHNHAFVWTSTGGMQDLNNLLALNAPSGWTLTYAYGIDDAGHIVGYGTNSSGATHAFLLTPALRAMPTRTARSTSTT